MPNRDLPTMVVPAEMEGGGRCYGQRTDCDPARVAFEMSVERRFRRIHEDEGITDYS